MDRMVKTKLFNLINENSQIKIETIDKMNQVDLFNDLAFDSMQIMKLITDIESEFQITFNYEVLDNEFLKNIENIENYILEAVDN